MSQGLVIDASWTLFLDRDGVINHRIDNDYVLQQSDFLFCDGALKAIEILSNRFQYVFVVTNQQCIAKGLLKETELAFIHEEMCAQIKSSGGTITKVYAAPELKNDPASTRKPSPFMALKAQAEYAGIDFSSSIMVGDTDSDIEFGQRLGMKTVLIESKEEINAKPDFRFASLYDFSINLL
ncbi:MAG: HAD-IIIA family hydrolase [Flavobacteriia bacterium]|nr:HAD-IIIA family hydrolase [Flavobacteriia bacterium]